MRSGKLRIQLERPAALLRGVVKLPAFIVGAAKRKTRFRRRHANEKCLESPPGLLPPPLFQVADAEQVKEAGVLRLLGTQGLQPGHCRCSLAGAQFRSREQLANL